MPKRRGLTDKQVATLSRKEKRYTLPDPEQPGHYLRVPARSSRAPIAFAAVARDPNGKQIWKTIGTADAIGIDQARELARGAIRRIKSGQPTSEPGRLTVRDAAEQWLERHVRKNAFRTARESERIVNTYIVPHIGSRAIADVRRIDVAELLDRIEDENGQQMADGVLKVFRAISRWLQQRDESYNPPLTAGMGRVPKGEGRRKRILGDDEIRKVWRAEQEPYSAFVKLALLTAQRREKLLTLRWDDLDSNGVWTIRTEAREKGNPGMLKLPQAALDIIEAQPRFVGNPYVFAGRNGGPTAKLGAGQYKQQFDKLCGVKDWRIHDLRRTARSLMARAGVQTEIAERVLGHAQGELIEIYDRHTYQDEMAAALEKLATLIKQITS
jgi:integrase